jgi:hypothetical protein
LGTPEVLVSDDYLRLIPREPEFVPDSDASAEAVLTLRSLAPLAEEVKVSVTETIRFIDQGGNFERVLCPKCGAELNEWWVSEMDKAWENRSTNLVTSTPCCETTLSLNDLEYQWPAGFSRYVLEVRNPSLGGCLKPAQVARLESILGCELRQVLAHY